MKSIGIGIVFLFLTVYSGYCQEVEQPLQLTITSNKEVYHIGDKILLDFSVKNTADTSIVIGHNHPDELESKTDYLVITPEGGKYPAHIIPNPAWERDKNKDFQEIVVNSNDSVEFRGVVINKQGRDDDFFKNITGRYKLRWLLGEIPGLKSKPISNTTIIEIKEKIRKKAKKRK